MERRLESALKEPRVRFIYSNRGETMPFQLTRRAFLAASAAMGRGGAPKDQDAVQGGQAGDDANQSCPPRRRGGAPVCDRSRVRANEPPDRQSPGRVAPMERKPF